MVVLLPDPFFTTRTTRKVGLGISLFKMAAELSDGSFKIDSTVDVGTVVHAVFGHNHINRAPLGVIEDTISILCLNETDIDITYTHNYNDACYVFSTAEVKEVLDGIPFTDYNVIMWIKNNIKDIQSSADLTVYDLEDSIKLDIPKCDVLIICTKVEKIQKYIDIINNLKNKNCLILPIQLVFLHLFQNHL